MRIDKTIAILSWGLFPLSLFAQTSEPSSGPTPLHPVDLFSKDREVVSPSVEWLYWTVQEGALNYALKMNHSAPTPGYAIGHVKSATFDIDSGVRCAINYYNAPKYWEVRGQYTHLISRGKDRVAPPTKPDTYLVGTWPQDSLGTLSHAHSSILFNYNLFDLMIDRMFVPNPHLRVRMIAGLSCAWIKQNWKFQYFDIAASSNTYHHRWSYTAGGMRIGVSGDWFWGNDIYLTGLFSMGIYMGTYHNRVSERIDSSGVRLCDYNYFNVRPSVTAQCQVGPSWQKSFSAHNWMSRMELFVGYEINAWFNLQEITASSGGAPSINKNLTSNNNLLALQGLSTRLTMDF